VPADVPARRAVLAGTVETAVNIVWDAEPSLGERVTVVGAGMVGSCVARRLSQVSGTSVTLVDTNPERRSIAEAFGVAFAQPADAPADQDLVVHTSATPAGLSRSLELLRPERTVIEASWFGDAAVPVPLGGAFHSRRLTIRASQVGTIAPAHRGDMTHRDRLELALDLLTDPAYDVLLTETSRFGDLPETMAAIASGSLQGLCHTVSYEGEND
jgi:threonine dehydrogenase-like Zn-dependent dehydrogenase